MGQGIASTDKLVSEFRQILLWPLQLMPILEGLQIQKHWQALTALGPANPWREVVADPAELALRHYAELIAFLPQVQRFLYGDAQQSEGGRQSPIRVFRRGDVAAARLSYDEGVEPLTFEVGRTDLIFFYDIDVAILVVEIGGRNLGLSRVQDTLYRFGRAYPAQWQDDGTPSRCLQRVEWLGTTGEVLGASDYEDRDRYLAFVARTRTPCIASHWEYLLDPLVLQDSERPGSVRFGLLEYYRMPLIAYLALEDPRALSRGDFVRLALVTEPGQDGSLPFSAAHVRDFEQRYCYDRYWSAQPPGPATRFLCCGHALVVVGPAGERVFSDPEIGVAAQIRHQYFLMFLIAHFHKAALLMFSSRLVAALNKLNIQDAESVKRFKRIIRQLFEVFLRFSHRYWFHDISDQAQVKDLFRLCTGHLGTEPLYAEVRQEIQDMAAYLDSDSLRRQANTVVRLTVVTTFGLIATVASGLLGMNLIDEAEASLPLKLWYFALSVVPTTLLILFAILKSKKLSDFLEALSDERLPLSGKYEVLAQLWRKERTK